VWRRLLRPFTNSPDPQVARRRAGTGTKGHFGVCGLCTAIPRLWLFPRQFCPIIDCKAQLGPAAGPILGSPIACFGAQAAAAQARAISASLHPCAPSLLRNDASEYPWAIPPHRP